MPTEKGQLGPRPSKKHLPKDGAGGTGGDAASISSHTSRVSFSSRLQVQLSKSSAPAARGEKPSRHSRPQSSRSRPNSARPGRGQRSAASSPVPLPPPANTAARGQCRRLRSCVACSGKATPDTASTVPSTPSTPALTETEALSVHQLTQTPESWRAAERVDRDTQTESPGRERRAAPVRLFMDRGAQTLPSALPLRAASGELEPRPWRLSRVRRLLRACRCSCTAAAPEPLGAGPKSGRRPQAAAQGHTTGIGVLMVIQEAAEGTAWSPYSSWPWLAETSL
ncbi:unnamed protein product [Coccothraustes coccothraustes]